MACLRCRRWSVVFVYTREKVIGRAARKIGVYINTPLWTAWIQNDVVTMVDYQLFETERAASSKRQRDDAKAWSRQQNWTNYSAREGQKWQQFETNIIKSIHSSEHTIVVSWYSKRKNTTRSDRHALSHSKKRKKGKDIQKVQNFRHGVPMQFKAKASQFLKFSLVLKGLRKGENPTPSVWHCTPADSRVGFVFPRMRRKTSLSSDSNRRACFSGHRKSSTCYR